MRNLAISYGHLVDRVKLRPRTRRDRPMADSRAGVCGGTWIPFRSGRTSAMSPAAAPRRSATVHIHRPARSVVQAGRANTRFWLLEFEPRTAPFIEPLMGWTGSQDTLQQVCLKFPTKEQAIAFAEGQGWAFSIAEPREPRPKPKSYADNFRAGGPNCGIKRREGVAGKPAKSSAGKCLNQPGQSTNVVGGLAAGDGRRDSAIDLVEEAAIESFPASDPPSWIGTTVR